MTAVLDLPANVARYLEDVVEVLADTLDLEGAYLVGSGALGGYDPARSDVDVYAVAADSLSEHEKRDVGERVAALATPARRLELVVYSRAEAASAEPRFELNLGDPDASPHWFVIDRAIADEHAIPLYGPPWRELFTPVPREQLLDALGQALSWFERHEPAAAAVTAGRTWAWLETGRWLPKPQAVTWLVERVRARLEDER